MTSTDRPPSDRPSSNPPQGVLFDVDGTLVDTSFVHTLCWWQALRRTGRDMSMATIHRAVGMGSDLLVPHLLGETPEDEVQALTEAHDALYSAHWPALRPLPGARDLVRRCHEAGLKTVLASSASEQEVAVVHEVLDVRDWLDATTTSADAETSKPAPDLVQAALDSVGLDPATAVFVGDAVWDVQASGRAGMRCIGLECGGTSAAELREAGAAQTFRDPADLLEHWDDSLLAEK